MNRHLVYESKAYNKRFKRDSQRAAFLLCVGFLVTVSCGKLVVALAALKQVLYFFSVQPSKGFIMNVDKAKKRILKRVQRGFRGYPQISLEYFGETTYLATEVVITFV
ncbi:hypothetical protein GWZ69_03325 [Vibrio cholerae]|nr:hypothetical protein [Vibrio cholerae]